MSQHFQTKRAKQAAYFLSDFADALIECDMAVDVVAEILVASSPVVMIYAMKGALE